MCALQRVSLPTLAGPLVSLCGEVGSLTLRAVATAAALGGWCSLNEGVCSRGETERKRRMQAGRVITRHLRGESSGVMVLCHACPPAGAMTRRDPMWLGRRVRCVQLSLAGFGFAQPRCSLTLGPSALSQGCSPCSRGLCRISTCHGLTGTMDHAAAQWLGRPPTGWVGPEGRALGRWCQARWRRGLRCEFRAVAGLTVKANSELCVLGKAVEPVYNSSLSIRGTGGRISV